MLEFDQRSSRSLPSKSNSAGRWIAYEPRNSRLHKFNLAHAQVDLNLLGVDLILCDPVNFSPEQLIFKTDELILRQTLFMRQRPAIQYPKRCEHLSMPLEANCGLIASDLKVVRAYLLAHPITSACRQCR